MQVFPTKFQTHHWIFLIVFFLPYLGVAQNNSSDSLLQEASLEKVIQYTLANQPAIKQAEVDQEITNKAIRGRLADWYPQINFALNYQRNFELPANAIQTDSTINIIRFGVNNTSSAQFSASQNIFNRDVLLASSTASKVRLQASQNTSLNRIDAVVNVTKAFYDLLATSQQVKVSQESIVRLERSLKDAYSRYTAGITDKTDYKRATILLGNAKASLKANNETLKFKENYLKTIMGYPVSKELPVRYDTLQMENEVLVDTLQQMNYTEHINYRLLYTQRELQNANVKYSNMALLPTLSAVGVYNVNFQNNTFNDLYNVRYPVSYVGATLSVPLFQGFKRVAKIQEQRLTRDRLDIGLANLENSLNTEYSRALAAYKSNLEYYLTQKENVVLAKEVYDIIQLQYSNGIKAYLDVTIAETDLRTARINYFNALYSVLASKIDMQKALGQINY
jgi:outer membrane protein